MKNTRTFVYCAPEVYDAAECINEFEADAAEYIVETKRRDIGGIMLYHNANGLEVARFDYELLSGHVRLSV